MKARWVGRALLGLIFGALLGLAFRIGQVLQFGREIAAQLGRAVDKFDAAQCPVMSPQHGECCRLKDHDGNHLHATGYGWRP